MTIEEFALEPGTYVVAVSGGVDSMVLLDLLRQNPDLHLVVAHLDHGIRHDSHLDRELVQAVAKQHGLQFVYDEANLGDTSEEAARRARYEFLHRVREAANARAIVTAHHQDDLLETAILNLSRGTNRKGLTSLRSTDVVKRPMLGKTKNEIREFARQKGIIWREDVTNQDTNYTRNYIRHNVIPRLSAKERKRLLDIIHRMHEVNDEIDARIVNHLHTQPAIGRLNRRWFVSLTHAEAKEIMAAWLRRHGIREFDKKTIERLVWAGKTLEPGRQTDVNKTYVLEVGKDDLALSALDR